MKRIWLGIGALAALLAVAPVAAQVAQDFPNLKGFNSRTGRNGDLNSGPGRANIRWWTPNGLNSTNDDEYVIDDTDENPPLDPADTPDQGPYQTNPYGFVTYNGAQWSPAITTTDPPVAADDAYQVRHRSFAETVGGTTWPRNFNLREPAYRYTRATASGLGNDPRVAAQPSDRRAFTWNFRPSPGTPGQYALYVWLPIQPTRIGPPADPRVFPQRYYVYDIRFGGNQQLTEVVDSYASGGGWVRLGNGGKPTGVVFPYDGVNDVTITLYNTVPRDEDGDLDLPDGITNPNQVLVYADAALAIPQPGYYAATPTSARLVDGDINSTVVTAANNRRDTATNEDTGNASSFTDAEVTNYDYQNGNVRWRYSPVAETDEVVLEDDDTATLAGTWEENAAWTHNTGDGARVSLINDNTPSASAFYNFGVPRNGSYAVYAFIPPNVPGRPLAQAAQYLIEVALEDGTYRSTTVTIDQSDVGNRGWVRLGGRFFHDVNLDTEASTPLPIRVTVLNSSGDPADYGARYVYADAIRVTGETTVAVTSSPVHATALVRKTRGAAPELTKVVFIADEDGVIHCLDAEGDRDSSNNLTGTTREYWRYPSSKDTAGFDPNLVTGEDWTGPDATPYDERSYLSEKPSGFDLSTALVQRVVVGGENRDYLYIGSTNGRVYCIDVAGRGDGDGSPDPVSNGTRTVGTTTRVWTIPNTYPSPNPVEQSTLGPFRGSLAYGEPAANQPTIYIPTSQGRMYAVDALGNPANKTTSLRWAFPAVDQPTVGPILGTPSVEFGRVYFGTMRKDIGTDGEQPGRIYALDWATGALVWAFERTDATSTNIAERRTDDFQSSPITVPGASISGAAPNVVYALNENRILYAIDADTGQLWFANDELQTGAVGSLGFTRMTVPDNTGLPEANVPVVLVPGTHGQFTALYADRDRSNRLTLPENAGNFNAYFRSVWGWTTEGDSIVASMSVSNNWMYGADTRGFLYAWNDGTGLLVPGDPPGAEVLVPNNPAGNVMRKTKVRLISGDMYRRLRRPEGDANRANYAQAVANGTAYSKNVFEWGETAYVLVYDFPYLIENGDGEPVDPPIINVSFVADGRTLRGVSVQSRRFDTDSTLDTTVPRYDDVQPLGPQPGVTDNPRLNGYAILAFPLQNGGANAVPPGSGEITVNLQTAALNNNGALQTVALDPNRWSPTNPNPAHAWSRFPFQVANPLAIIMPPENGIPSAFPTLPNGVPTTPGETPLGMGLARDPGNLADGNYLKSEALLNGSIDIPGDANKFQNQFGTTPSKGTAHGNTARMKVWVVDRSYMTLLRPGGEFGLDNIRLDRRDLAWQGGAAAVIKRFDVNYPGFEDLPINFPNDSLDYPDLRREQVKVTKEPNGSAENPLFNGVALRAPRTPTGGTLQENTLPQDRRFVPTEFEVEVDVPVYQPANSRFNLQSANPAAIVNSSRGVQLGYQGYAGRMQVFVDSAANGRLDMGQREAYRSFNYTTAVDVDERLRVTTPTIDLGTLPAGTGYSPRETRPGYSFDPSAALNTLTDVLHPWRNSVYEGVFRNFGVVNEGNVNLLNVRAAKASDASIPLSINPEANDGLAWLNGVFNLHTNIDQRYSAGPDAIGRPVILQKPRVSDRVPTQLRANPVRRVNPNTGVTAPTPLNQTLDPSPPGGRRFDDQFSVPRVGVSVPIGFPVGKYSTRVLIYEETQTTPNHSSSWTWGNRNNVAIRGGENTLNLPFGREPFTEPGFLLSFNVSETRLTNTYTPKTAPQIDNLVPTSDPSTLRFQNTQPAATRDPNGALIVAFASNRTGWGAAADTGSFSGAGTRLYLATLDSGGNFTGSGYTVQDEFTANGSRLRDLGLWRAGSAGQWFRQEVGGFPTAAPTTYFGADVNANTVRYDNPAFPTSGFQNPFASGAFSNAKLAFVGRATRNTPSGQIEESRLFVTGVRTNTSGRITGMAGPSVMANDPQVAKSEPSVVQTAAESAVIFYTGVSAGQTNAYYVRFDPARFGAAGFGPSSPLPFGSGFLSVSGVSATGRNYTGARADDDPASRPIVEMTFTGQLRGRPYPEVFLARAGFELQADGSPYVPMRLPEANDGTLRDSVVFEDLPEVTNDALERESPGIYRARGVAWRRDAPIQLFQMANGVTTDLLVPNTRAADRETGLISYETRLGGRVTIDPAQGTFRFTNAVPTGNARLFATYTPRFLRLSESANQGGGASKTSAMYDQHFISDASYWRRGNGNQVTNEPITNDRLVLMWNRAASGTVTARPFMSSLRFGVNLPFRLPTLPDGRPGYQDGDTVRPAVNSVTVVGFGAVDAYEIDPNGKIYLPQAYEGFPVVVQHVAVDANGNLITSGGNPVIYDTPGRVTYVTERAQQPVPIETAVNESNLTAFIDPFNYQNDRRPPLVWLFWSSTRGGVPDLYFETIAPLWNPVPIAK